MEPNCYLPTKVLLEKAQSYADMNSTCAKVKVGSLIISDELEVVKGCNRGIEYNCTKEGCLRIKKYGEASKDHRLPSDCVALHSEVDAITKAVRQGINLTNAVIYVTRYPCEACARAIANSGIRLVVYGRKEPISEMTENIFRAAGCGIVHEAWEYEDNNS